MPHLGHSVEKTSTQVGHIDLHEKCFRRRIVQREEIEKEYLAGNLNLDDTEILDH